MQQTANQRRVSFYDQVGGAEGVSSLVNTFCDLIETREEGKPVLLLHLRGHGMEHARVEQFNFFSGFLGGPKLYAEKWGHSNVREIHAHVEIDDIASQAWLTCMSMAMDNLAYPALLKNQLMQNFSDMAALLKLQSQSN